jgi:CRP-like cAMP-binding protein
MDRLDRILREHPFFAGLHPSHLDVLVGCTSNIRFRQGDFVCRHGQEADQFFVLREGKVAVEIETPERGVITVQTLNGSEVLGWSWLIPPYFWRFDARAVTPVRALALDGRCLRGKCEEDHDLGFELLKRFAHVVEQRLQATRMQLVEIHSAYWGLMEGTEPR